MSLSDKGYRVFERDPRIAEWVRAAYPVAYDISRDPQHVSDWLRHGGTWFAGVNVFPNDMSGTWPDGPNLEGAVIDAARALCPFEIAWDAAQISIPYKGYPKRDPTESDANHRFRKTRDAAHLDGLRPIGPGRRRFMLEYHACILGLPLNEALAEAAPLVVWEGSHEIIRDWLTQKIGSVDPADWKKVDLTESYATIRKHVFATCPRVTVTVPCGASYLVHRFAIHGLAPWPETVNGPEEGRMIAYFRPHWRSKLESWLSN